MNFRKKPVTVAALRFDGTPASAESIKAEFGMPDAVYAPLNPNRFPAENAPLDYTRGVMVIPTLEGDHTASRGDWIIRGVKGECYPCKPDIFEMTYDPADSKRMDFGEALAALKAGGRVARAGWNGKGMWLAMVTQRDYNITPPELGHLVLAPFVAMKTADDKLVPWLASQTDVLADDWEEWACPACTRGEHAQCAHASCPCPCRLERLREKLERLRDDAGRSGPDKQP